MPTEPRRIQRKRTKGWRMPEGAVCVTRPTVWGNPYLFQHPMGRERAVSEFRRYAEKRAARDPDWLAPLIGLDLACWCRLDQPCHADVLLEIANR